MIRLLKKPGIIRSIQLVTLVLIMAVLLTFLYFYIFPLHNYYCNSLDDLWVNQRLYKTVGLFPGGRHCSCPVAKDGILLTFDDGPTPFTSVLLDNLRRLNVSAIFFIKGSNVAERPEVLRRMARDGHSICSHSYSHPNLADLENSGRMDLIREEITMNEQIIFNITGIHVSCFRPPYGQIGQQGKELLSQMGYTLVMWNSANTDWDYRDTQRSAKETLAYRSAVMGGISCWHDSSQETCDNIQVFVNMVRDMGSRVLTPRECFR